MRLIRRPGANLKLIQTAHAQHVGALHRSSSKKPMMACRKIAKVVASVAQSEGRGERVHRSIGRPELRNLDPFLLLDEFGREQAAAGWQFNSLRKRLGTQNVPENLHPFSNI